MNNKKVKVPVQNEIVDGLEVNINESKESWNEYKLNDGSIIKMKVVITKVVRTDKFKKNNEPIYYIESQNN